MNRRQAEKIKKHYLVWSGGFTPDTVQEIVVYVDYARLSGTDPDEVRLMLIDWMEEVDEAWH